MILEIHTIIQDFLRGAYTDHQPDSRLLSAITDSAGGQVADLLLDYRRELAAWEAADKTERLRKLIMFLDRLMLSCDDNSLYVRKLAVAIGVTLTALPDGKGFAPADDIYNIIINSS